MNQTIDTENPLKQAFFSLRELRTEADIQNPKLSEVLSNLSDLIETSQNGELY